MLLPIPEDVLQAQARDRALDLLVGSLGVSVAVVSVSFAAYMFVVGPSGRSTRSSASILALGSPVIRPQRTVATSPDTRSDSGPALADDIDFDPTGSIAPPATGSQSRSESSPNPGIVLPDFAVRDAFNGTALIEANGTLQMVQLGTVLEGAGKVLSITRRDKGWVVATSGGLILQRR